MPSSAVRVLTGGTLLDAFVETEKRAMGSESVARLLGFLRICAWDDEQWFLADNRCFRRESEAPAGKSEVERARQTVLENLPERWVRIAEQVGYAVSGDRGVVAFGGGSGGERGGGRL